MHLLRTLALFVWFAAPLAFGETVKLGGGTIQLPEGYLHTPQQGRDTVVGTIKSKDGKIEIRYEIGGMSRPYVEPSRKEGTISFAETKVGTLTVYTGVYPGLVTICFPKGGPANFTAKVKGDEAIEAVKKVVMTFRPGGEG